MHGILVFSTELELQEHNRGWYSLLPKCYFYHRKLNISTIFQHVLQPFVILSVLSFAYFYARRAASMLMQLLASRIAVHRILFSPDFDCALWKLFLFILNCNVKIFISTEILIQRLCANYCS